MTSSKAKLKTRDTILLTSSLLDIQKKASKNLADTTCKFPKMNRNYFLLRHFLSIDFIQ